MPPPGPTTIAPSGVSYVENTLARYSTFGINLTFKFRAQVLEDVVNNGMGVLSEDSGWKGTSVQPWDSRRNGLLIGRSRQLGARREEELRVVFIF